MILERFRLDPSPFPLLRPPRPRRSKPWRERCSRCGLLLAHLDAARADRASSGEAAAGSANEVKVRRIVHAILNAHAEARVRAVVGPCPLQLQRIPFRGHRTALIADAAEHGQLVDKNFGAGVSVVELQAAFEETEAAGSAFRVEG